MVTALVTVLVSMATLLVDGSELTTLGSLLAANVSGN
jgi:hypothetical protein